ncbi:MAG TPA: PEP/pyruvate-binding domain-containing protein [Intrasporangium sp.]|uniref:PEP/pyruvate-binding domain-containing protein n=1 Tax=Intrasporangium sp. TaxID=1925024 RepID=UPI002B4597EE|nr:PEP/pyruvate-binding domain-containing protein [Intrasporangium sp.]HKX68458.1 PEP/pyruvate-binding domain-containing protein [Intrasporangium sp.]
MTRLCLPLERLDRNDLPTAGGKGANLGELIRAGFAVPRGFVVTTDAYRSAVGGLAHPTREAITALAVPHDVRTAVQAGYAELGGGPVAVRSSATAEDLPGAAFAGQQDTFLGVVGADAVVDAVRDCWASLWTERAVAYRARFTDSVESVAMAVVVQQLVAADWAGVMFTANPVTGARDQVVIESSPGLGESVVSGAVTPDHAVLAADGSVVERHAGRHEVVVRPIPGGGTTTDPGDPGTTPLPDSVLAQLAEQGRAVAAHFGAPQDIEWALTSDDIVLTQSRPMTALPPAPLRLNRFQRLIGPVISEMLPRRPLPMELSAWSSGVILRHLERLLGGMAAVRVDPDQTLPTVDGIVQAFVPALPRPTGMTPIRLARSIARSVRHRPGDWVRDPLASDISRRADTLAAFDVGQATWAELIAVRARARAIVDDVADLRVEYLPSAGRALVALKAVLALVGAAQRTGDLIVGGDTQTMQANAALESMAATVQADPTLHQAFRTRDGDELVETVMREPAEPSTAALRHQLADFNGRFGHRETTSVMLLKDPTWGDSPATVLGLVRVLLTHAEGAATHVPSTGSAALERLLRAPRVRLFRAQSLLRSVVRNARDGIALREDTHFEITRPMPVVRRTVLELGERLAATTWIDRPEDVWYLLWDEVASLADPSRPQDDHQHDVQHDPQHDRLRSTVARRRRAYAELASSPLIATATLYPDRGASDAALLTGLAGGGGRATGSVRVIRHPDEFGTVSAGEVLVSPATNPAWTPLFARVAAVVVDHGGPASHAAIVAREYGIPAVLAVGTGTTTLSTGQRVTVDGDHGLVLAADEGGVED